MQIVFGVIGPSIPKQCKEKGVISTGMDVDLVEKLSKAISLCYIHGVITETERNKATDRLVKAAKFKVVE